MAPNPDAPGFLRRHAADLARFAGLVGVIVLFAALDVWKNPVDERSFLTIQNFRTVATHTVIVAIGAMGATCVIISAGIDLSFGSVVALSTVVIALGLVHGLSPWLAAALGVLVGGVCGAINGLATTALRIPPFIATLGMMSIARGVAKWMSGSQTVLPPSSTWLEELMPIMPGDRLKWMVVAPGVWMMILVALAVSIMLRKTVFGRHIFALGSSEATARLCGLPVGRIRVQIYALAGLLTGISGVLQFSRLTLGDPTVSQGQELDVIAAVVIGGGSLTGGEGSVSGALIGAFILQFLRNGCNLMGLQNFVQDVIVGLIIIGAVTVDQQRKRMSA